MGYNRTTGSIRGFALNGIPFTPLSDANFTEKPSEYENEAIATSGAGMIKKVKMPQVLESVTLGTSAAERVILAGLADGTDTMSCSYVDAAGNTHRNPAVGINIEGNETETNTTTITVQPVEPWTVSLA